jgi:hypothetical protein
MYAMRLLSHSFLSNENVKDNQCNNNCLSNDLSFNLKDIYFQVKRYILLS